MTACSTSPPSTRSQAWPGGDPWRARCLPPYAARYSESGRSLGRVVLRRGGEVAIRLSAPALVEVDGDLLAPTQGMRVRLDPGALLIRRPAA